MSDTRPAAIELFANLKKALPDLTKLLEEVGGHWQAEDGFYRFYHMSFKVFHLQHQTTRIVTALQSLAPDQELNQKFVEIVAEGTNKNFSMKTTNQNWMKETRPILEAFFHAKTMLEFAVKYGTELDEPPNMLPSGWAAFLYLYNLR